MQNKMKLKKLNFMLFFTVVFAVLFLAFTYQPKSDDDKKVIKFDHAVHTEAAECKDCHENAATAEKLSRELLPEKKHCASCHDVEDQNKCTDCHYGEDYQALEFETPEIMFNHKNHLGMENVNCDNCHKTTKPDGTIEINNPPMMKCSSCHNQQTSAAIDCEICHVNTDNLLPQNHLTGNFKKMHGQYAGKKEADCAMCHTQDFCGSCHEASNMNMGNNPSEALSVYSPHSYLNNTKQQKLSRVHTIGFKFTHGIEAKGKVSECSSCHTVETFCEECHSSNGGNPTHAGLVPSTHLGINFITFGVGSGGGRHAQLAKRDLESCASCHDTQGSDPSCILCHSDADGIKGTNPKTHIRNYMRDEDGDWHTSQNSLCFNCHTDANANPKGVSGVGFCGYCHAKK